VAGLPGAVDQASVEADGRCVGARETSRPTFAKQRGTTVVEARLHLSAAGELAGSWSDAPTSVRAISGSKTRKIDRASTEDSAVQRSDFAGVIVADFDMVLSLTKIVFNPAGLGSKIADRISIAAGFGPLSAFELLEKSTGPEHERKSRSHGNKESHGGSRAELCDAPKFLSNWAEAVELREGRPIEPPTVVGGLPAR